MIKKKKKFKFLKIIKKKWRKINKKKLFYITLLVTIFILFYFILKTTLFSPKNQIKQIYLANETIKTYYNPYLAKLLQQQLSGENIILIQLFKKKEILNKLKQIYPIIKNLSFDWNNTKQSIIVHIKYNNPNLIFTD